LQLVDDKNRVSIPAKFRDAVIANSDFDALKSGATVIIAVHPQGKCLIGYDEGYLDGQIDRASAVAAARANEYGDPDDNIFRRMAGGGEPTNFDSTGRCVLLGWQKRKVGLTKHAFFYGSIDYFEVWDPEALFADPDAPEVMKDACRFIMEDKGLL
jgi:MraZ protein